MSHESPIADEYEPADIDPDAPLSSPSDDSRESPIEADPADWVDQHRAVSEDDDDDQR